MAQTVVGLFDNTAEAQSAVQDLLNAGFTHANIDTATHDAAPTTGSTTDSHYENDSVSQFFSSLFGSEDHSRNYSDVTRRGSTVVTVHAQSTDEAARAAEVLDRYNAIDVDERAAQYRTATTHDTTQHAAHNTTQNTAHTAHDTAHAAGDTSIPVIEEQLQVGKQTVETGGARIRSRVVERPVEENLRLRQERISVNRTPVDRVATDADLNTFKEGTIEMTEHGEVATINKEARVVEEISLGKQVEERTETVTDTVRSTEVEVEEIETDKTRRNVANR